MPNHAVTVFTLSWEFLLNYIQGHRKLICTVHNTCRDGTGIEPEYRNRTLYPPHLAKAFFQICPFGSFQVLTIETRPTPPLSPLEILQQFVKEQSEEEREAPL